MSLLFCVKYGIIKSGVFKTVASKKKLDCNCKNQKRRRFVMWTHAHVVTLLPAIAVYIVVAIILGVLLRKASEKVRMIPIHIITILLIGLEVIKQYKAFQDGTYEFKELPLYYCSLFLFFYLFVSLYKGKDQNCFRVLTVTSGITVFVVMMVFPDIIYSDSAIENALNDFGDFHTVAFHNLVFLGTALMISLRLFEINFKKDLICTLSVYLMYCVVAAPTAIYLGENFNQFHHCYVPQIENLRQLFISNMGASFGQAFYMFCNTITTVGFSVLMFLVIAALMTWCQKIIKKHTKKTL